ncbi:DUF3261 domain-containing protein [Nitrincola sp. MINF-07-Sa-05]|uniref:DUF3261 domain-containing protein n=1 Tax=Nitrincola salilacus TaxID=3400273 RepID=UPI003917E145
MFRLFGILIFGLLLSACQVLSSTAAKDSVPMAGGSYRLYPGWPGPDQQWLQHIQWRNGTKTHEFMLSASLTEHSILLVGMSPLGQELWRLSYDETGGLQTAGVEPFNDPEFASRVLAEMQLALLPMELLEPRLTKLRMTEALTSNYQRRLIDAEGGEVLSIIWKGEPEPQRLIELTQAHYQLIITTLEVEML